MSAEVRRGFAGKAGSWNLGLEGGFIAYMRGSIGDKPAPQERILYGDASKFDDVPVLSESVLRGMGNMGEDVPSISESWTIING